MRYVHTLAFRVLVGSCLFLITLFGFYTYFAVQFHTAQMDRQVRSSALSLSNIIKNSTRYSMLKFQTEDLRETIRNIGREPGVEIRLYNKRGRIMVATDSAQEGRVVGVADEACKGCHHDPQSAAAAIPAGPSAWTYQGPAGIAWSA